MSWNGYSYGSPSIDDLSIDSDAIPAKKMGALADYDLHKKVEGTSQDTRHFEWVAAPRISRDRQRERNTREASSSRS
jgi:hypothetical protein